MPYNVKTVCYILVATVKRVATANVAIAALVPIVPSLT